MYSAGCEYYYRYNAGEGVGRGAIQVGRKEGLWDYMKLCVKHCNALQDLRNLVFNLKILLN